jgi:diguanylate cyclase (GGDEF)-like protein
MNSDLHDVTSKVLSEVMKHDIVLPTLYRESFFKLANELGVDIDEDKITEALDRDVEKYYDIMGETEESLSRLENYTKDAQSAIVTKDDKKLGEISSDIDKLKKELEYLRGELYLDSLTKCQNRRWITDKLLSDGSFQRDGLLTFIDLNDFKLVNDTYGHAIGDKILVFFADYIRKNLSTPEDTLIRFAGDEFLIISYAHQEPMVIENYYASLREKLSNTKLKVKEDKISVSFSYGVSEFKKGEEFKEVVDVADRRMYEDKQNKHKYQS